MLSIGHKGQDSRCPRVVGCIACHPSHLRAIPTLQHQSHRESKQAREPSARVRVTPSVMEDSLCARNHIVRLEPDPGLDRKAASRDL